MPLSPYSYVLQSSRHAHASRSARRAESDMPTLLSLADVTCAPNSATLLHHMFLRVEFVLGHRQVGPHEIDDAVIDPPRGGCLIDCVEGEFQLCVRLVAEIDRDDLQVVAQDNFADVAVRRGGELEADSAKFRLVL